MLTADFDALALFEAMDSRRAQRGLTWTGAATEMWALSAALNEHDGAHPIAASTLRAVEKRLTTTCQHALFMLRWLGRSPESFIPSVKDHPRFTLPAATSAQRLRWDLSALSTALGERRHTDELTWKELSNLLDVGPSQLTGLRQAKYAIDMIVAMRIGR